MPIEGLRTDLDKTFQRRPFFCVPLIPEIMVPRAIGGGGHPAYDAVLLCQPPRAGSCAWSSALSPQLYPMDVVRKMLSSVLRRGLCDSKSGRGFRTYIQQLDSNITHFAASDPTQQPVLPTATKRFDYYHAITPTLRTCQKKNTAVRKDLTHTTSTSKH